ncbi:hypothetical protein [Clostridium sp. D43t1_170807_H7]|uniref:hypothetical protein n=1 Tax=Clostridium sp. D43t1_170807_H7 TaxID=2787140 RepID=UPI001899B237|nr:hypothetical protein [Clostridium sp. D43t1_170807_H7]MEE0933750.1 hypothetical protein [Clostridium sp.]
MNNLKSILWTIVWIVIFIAIVKFFIYLLPFIIVIGLVGYIVFKGKKAFRNKEHNNETYNSYNQNVYEESSIDDDSNGEIIDVDYKEVDE